MPRIAWFSPISQDSSLRSAAFTHRVLAAAPLDWQVEVFVGDGDWLKLKEEQWMEPEVCGFGVYPFQNAFLHNNEKPFDVFIFQLEDSPECMFVQNSMAVWPGITVFHDMNLSRLGISYFQTPSKEQELPGDGTEERFGEDAKSVKDFQDRGWSIEIFNRAHPQGNIQFHQAGVVVVENARSVDEVKNREVAAPIEQTAFPTDLVDEVATQRDRARMRDCLQYGSSDFIVGYAGRFGIEDRIHTVIDAFSEFRLQLQSSPLDNEFAGGQARLLWMTADINAERDARGMLQRKIELDPSLDGAVEVIGSNHESGLLSLVSTVDVMLSVKFDVLRGPSLSLLGALARGIPAIISDFGPTAEIPEGAVLKAPLGQREKHFIKHMLLELSSNKHLRQSMSQAARSYIDTVCSPGAVVADLQEIIRTYEGYLKSLHEKLRSSVNQKTTSLLDNMALELSELDLAIDDNPASLDIKRIISDCAVTEYSWSRSRG